MPTRNCIIWLENSNLDLFHYAGTMHLPISNFFQGFWHFCGNICLGGKKNEKSALYLRVNVFSMRGTIGDTIFMSPTGDGVAILLGHPSHVKV